MRERNARIGMRLFVVYLVLYGGFVLLNAFAPNSMEWTPMAGVNLAIWYGFGLILAALCLALLYGMLCRDGQSNTSELDHVSRPGDKS